MMEPDDLPHELRHLPPSAELIYRILQDIEPATSAEITDATTCPYTTVGEALRRLHDAGLVTRRPDPSDLNAYQYETRY